MKSTRLSLKVSSLFMTLLCLGWTQSAFAAPTASTEAALAADSAEELDPYAPNVEETLQAFDKAYEEQTGESSHLPAGVPKLVVPNEVFNYYDEIVPSCYRRTCAVFIEVDKVTQHATLYLNGKLEAEWLVSTGIAGRSTKDFDRHPDGRIYNRYMSKKFPGGDYMGLGNMPYAVFIEGGFAIHGTPESNWPKLGQRASHGCIRMHPDNAKVFNQYVRQVGINSTWITVH